MKAKEARTLPVKDTYITCVCTYLVERRSRVHGTYKNVSSKRTGQSQLRIALFSQL